jgi:hypothetical protein
MSLRSRVFATAVDINSENLAPRIDLKFTLPSSLSTPGNISGGNNVSVQSTILFQLKGIALTEDCGFLKNASNNAKTLMTVSVIGIKSVRDAVYFKNFLNFLGGSVVTINSLNHRASVVDLRVRSNNNGAREALIAICKSVFQCHAIQSDMLLAANVSAIANTDTSPLSADSGVEVQRIPFLGLACLSKMTASGK